MLRVCFGYASGMLRVSGEMQCALWIKPREDMPFMAWRPGMQGLHMLIRLIDNKSQRPILVFILVSFISFCHSLERARRPTQSNVDAVRPLLFGELRGHVFWLLWSEKSCGSRVKSSFLVSSTHHPTLAKSTDILVISPGPVASQPFRRHPTAMQREASAQTTYDRSSPCWQVLSAAPCSSPLPWIRGCS